MIKEYLMFVFLTVNFMLIDFYLIGLTFNVVTSDCLETVDIEIYSDAKDFLFFIILRLP